jgi:hypothetical protein
MTISWESTSAVSAMVEVIHGSDFSYKKENHLPNDFVTFTRQCNNVKLANGTYPGTPLTVVFRVTATDASGKSAVDGGSDSM